MLTAQMSGCSVGYTRANNGVVRVSHHNIQNPAYNAYEERKQYTCFCE